MSPTRAWLSLIRPANTITAAADVMAGYFIAVSVMPLAVPYAPQLALLVAASMCLYAGGIILNDVFDAKIDAKERPERAIPSGKISRKSASIVSGILLLSGLALAYLADHVGEHDGRSIFFALVVCACVFRYNASAKHHPFVGPLFMGACRAANLLIGIAAFSATLDNLWWIALFSWLHIFCVTYLARNEVEGGKRFPIRLLIKANMLISTLLVILIFEPSTLPGLPTESNFLALFFISIFVFLTLTPSAAALKEAKPENIRRAVKGGIMALIPMNAAIACLFGFWWMGPSVMVLLPISLALAKRFAVT